MMTEHDWNYVWGTFWIPARGMHTGSRRTCSHCDEQWVDEFQIRKGDGRCKTPTQEATHDRAGVAGQ